MFWGLSPALDLLKDVKDFVSLKEKQEINVFLLGCCDPRHILMTMAQSYKYEPEVKVNFYILDGLMEIIARQILLMLTAMEPPDQLALREKACLWMELYGNSLLRTATATFLVNKSVQLIHMVTDLQYLSKRMSFIKINMLKFKERDSLENIFKYWQKDKFFILKFWDMRLRHSLGTRYDSKEGVFDWDYHMKLREIKGSEAINTREYVYWRKTGVAFTWLETEFSIPNGTLAVGVTREGDRLLHYGYQGDMVYGPFYAFGLNCQDENMTRTVNGVRVNRAADLTQRNLTRLLHEIQTRTPYEAPAETEHLGIAIIQTPDPPDMESTADIPREAPMEREEYSSLDTPHSVHFLSPSTTHFKRDFENFFDLIYIGQNQIKKASKFMAGAKKDCLVIAETQKFVFALKKEERAKYKDEISLFMKENYCEPVADFDPTEDSYAYFKMKGTSD